MLTNEETKITYYKLEQLVEQTSSHLHTWAIKTSWLIRLCWRAHSPKWHALATAKSRFQTCIFIKICMTWLWIKVQCTKHITQKAQSISWISTLLQFIHSDRQTAPTTDYSCSKQCVALHTRYSITHNLHTNIISTHRSSTCKFSSGSHGSGIIPERNAHFWRMSALVFLHWTSCYRWKSTAEMGCECWRLIIRSKHA